MTTAAATRPGREERRRQILLAAQRLFFVKPYEQVSIRELEIEAGLSRGPIYYYFRNKEEIYSAVVTEGLARVAALIADAARSAPGDEEAQLRAIVRAYLAEFTVARPLFDILLRFFFGMRHGVELPRDLLDNANALVAESVGTIVGVITSGVASGRFVCDDPGFQAMAMWGMMSTVVQMSDDNPRFQAVGRPRGLLLRSIEDSILGAVLAGRPGQGAC